MKWIVNIDGGPRRVNHAAAVVDNKIYSFGGYCTGENYRDNKKIDIFVLNTTTFRWRTVDVQQDLPHVPFQRYGHTVNSYGHLIYLWGGRNDTRACNVLYCYNTQLNKWSAPKVSGCIPEGRDGHSSCIINQHMYIFAGFLENSETYTQDVHMLDLHTMIWTYVKAYGTPPVYRDFHTAAGIDSMMYVYGGREVSSGWYLSQSREVYNNDLYALDTINNTWKLVSTVGEKPQGKRSHSAFVHSGKMYIFGGYNGKEREHYSSLHEFDPATLSWRRIQAEDEGPCPRRRQAVCVVGSRAYLFGGTSPKPDANDQNLDDLEDYRDFEEMFERGLIDHDDLFVLDFG